MNKSTLRPSNKLARRLHNSTMTAVVTTSVKSTSLEIQFSRLLVPGTYNKWAFTPSVRDRKSRSVKGEIIACIKRLAVKRNRFVSISRFHRALKILRPPRGLARPKCRSDWRIIGFRELRISGSRSNFTAHHMIGKYRENNWFSNSGRKLFIYVVKGIMNK